MSLADITSLIGLAGATGGAIKTVAEGVQAAKEMVSRKDPDLVALKKLISDLYDELIVAKKTQMLQQDALMELRDKTKKSEAFQAEKLRYALTRTEMGGMIYALRPEDARGEPPHDLCATCFQDEIKSVLQRVEFNTLECKRCQTRAFKPDDSSGGRLVGLTSGWDILKPYD